MPKIRDLGINTIPPTMRPLEVGDGGYYAMPEGGGTIECPDGTCDDDDDDDQGGTIECPDGTCEKDRDKDKDKNVLNTLAIAQLRQQLDQHIANI